MFGLKPFRDLASPVRILLQVNTALFLVCFLSRMLGFHQILNYVLGYGALIPVAYEQAWRYLTYAFLHVDLWHFLFNMLALWMFGDDVAMEIGYRRFWILYLFSAIFAGIFSIPFYLFNAMGAYTTIIGASGALMGIFVAYARLFPNRMILMFFFFPMRIRHAIWIFVAIDVLLANSGDTVAHFTHLGGILSGFLCMYLFEKNVWERLRGELKERKKSRDDEALEGEVRYLDREKDLNAILKKVSESGVSSLSESEKAFLIAESARRRNRRF